MTLTYRGHTYEHKNQAAPQDHAVLAYRGVTYKK
jgi:hypothetical protein